MTHTRALPAVSVTARFIGPTDGTLRRLVQGLYAPVTIQNGPLTRSCFTGYLLRAHLEAGARERGRIIGWRLEVCDPDRPGDQTTYDLPADLASCECRDYLTRSHRRADGRCKHIHALRQLLGQLGLPVLP